MTINSNNTMSLFESSEQGPTNLLPYDGIANYYGPIVSNSEADKYFDALIHDIAWKKDEVIIFGKRIVTKRKVAWYADRPKSYTYSNTTKTALPWVPVLLELKALVESVSGEQYNSCLLNLYHNGSEAMAWHSDAEKELKRNGAIGSLTFGVERKFSFKHKQSKQTISTILEHGSLLVMKETTQTYWLHRLPPQKAISTARINLTFRTLV